MCREPTHHESVDYGVVPVTYEFRVKNCLACTLSKGAHECHCKASGGLHCQRTSKARYKMNFALQHYLLNLRKSLVRLESLPSRGLPSSRAAAAIAMKPKRAA